MERLPLADDEDKLLAGFLTLLQAVVEAAGRGDREGRVQVPILIIAIAPMAQEP